MHGSLTRTDLIAIVRDQISQTDGSFRNLSVAAKDDYLIDTLIELGYVSHDQVAAVQPDAEATGEGVLDLMVSRGVLPALAVTQAKAAYFHAELVTLADMRLPDEVVSAIPRHVAKRYRVVPVYRDGGRGCADHQVGQFHHR